MDDRWNRRTVVAGTIGVGTSGVAGCLGTGGDDEADDTDSAADDDPDSADDDTDPRESAGTGSSTWPMYGYDTQGTSATEGKGPIDDPEIAWTASLGVLGYETPVVVDGTVFVPDGHQESEADVRALDAETGDEQWETELDLVTDRRTVLAVSDDTVYASSAAQLVALDRETGEIDWQAGPDGEGFSGDSLLVGSDVAVYDSGSRLIAVDLDDRTVAWDMEIEGDPGRPVMDDETVYTNSITFGSMVAISAEDGEVCWELDEGPQRGPPAVADGIVYFVDGFDAVAIDAADGEQVWEASVGASQETQPAIDGDTLVYLGATRITRLSASGDTQWEAQIDGSGVTGALTSQVFYTGTDRGTVSAIDRDTGEIEWDLDVGSRIRGELAVVDGSLYIIDRHGELYAIR